ncbi:unnamed protein product [Spirodela intermedia]|uniref:Uncharacterized protein n=1 Tax=Spirodela intermedia TaxID=51605 RepID=A0A7I8LEL5_SPIIN|nr:unnamed protein product [Spirodela intermedia]
MGSVSGSKPIAEPDALKIAIAVAFALFRSKRLGQQSAPPSSSLSDSDVHRWKRKAKERKRELISLKEELKQLEEGREPQSDAVPQIVSCRCHFFDGCGLSGARNLSSGVEGIGDGDAGCNDWIDDVLRRRFLRQDLDDNNEMEWLCTSVDFLLELCGSDFSENGNCNFASLSHQAMDSILDPFDNAFPDMHDRMFMMMQLTEFIISDNLHIWTKNGDLDSKLFEEWLRSILQARKALGALENRNGLYLIYLERIIGATAKQLHRKIN